MSYLVLSGTNPTGNVQNNCKRLWVTYTPASPIAVPLGQEFDISTLFPGNPTLSALFKTKRQGTFDIMTRIPLSLLAALYGLEGNKAAYVIANSQQPGQTINVTGLLGYIPATAVPAAGLTGLLDAVPPTVPDVTIGGNATFPQTDVVFTGGSVVIPAANLVQNVVSISFAIDLFPKGRIFADGDLLELTVQSMPVSSDIKIYVSDFPFMYSDDKPFKFRTQTVLANNDYQIDFKGRIIFPNDAALVDSVQMAGNSFVQWDLVDFYCNADSDWVTNKTTYNSSPYIYQDTEMLQNFKFKALAQFSFYYKTKF
jgi:hypothetical protein